MDRVAIFVDAGYLFAQGSSALSSGGKKPRADLALDAPAAIDAVKKLAAEKAPNCKLLRIYWYDGAIGGARPTPEQALLAHLDDVKLRLGFVNSAGQQKGVDSLIVTDLIELARLGSINDALLLSGDEDVRIGVQIAQNYGVRIHLLGIVPSRGSQSHQLLQEADTTTEWNSSDIERFLMLRKPDVHIPAITEADRITPTNGQLAPKLKLVIQTYVSNLLASDLQSLLAFWESERGVPSEHDGVILPKCREVLGRKLEKLELKQVRQLFRHLAEERMNSTQT